MSYIYIFPFERPPTRVQTEVSPCEPIGTGCLSLDLERTTQKQATQRNKCPHLPRFYPFEQPRIRSLQAKQYRKNNTENKHARNKSKTTAPSAGLIPGQGRPHARGRGLWFVTPGGRLPPAVLDKRRRLRGPRPPGFPLRSRRQLTRHSRLPPRFSTIHQYGHALQPAGSSVDVAEPRWRVL